MSTWVIEQAEGVDVIEEAVNTALGMSLIADVMISVRDDTALVCAHNGDTASIPCESNEAAQETARAIWRKVQHELATLPPFSMRKSIKLV